MQISSLGPPVSLAVDRRNGGIGSFEGGKYTRVVYNRHSQIATCTDIRQILCHLGTDSLETASGLALEVAAFFCIAKLSVRRQS